MVESLKRLKRALCAFLLRMKIRREANAAFRYDRRLFMRNAGALHPERKAAAVSEIVMGYHVLEKGITMPHRRLGFGRDAACRLADLIDSFERRFGKGDGQVDHAASVLRAYRELHRDWPAGMERLDAFLAEHPCAAAVEPHVRRADFFAARESPFPAFAASRHVVRHFGGPVPRETIERAVSVALTAPSACNRQHARVHAVCGKRLIERLFALQGGTRGFGQDADKALVVTADLSSVRWGWERHDAYVNGGIFVMNLAYALHHCGVAHCILHWSVSPRADAEARKLLGIPGNEAIVQILACGLPPEEFDVAASPRRPLCEAMVWHGGAG
ncbi:MAG: nitroreductase family protein [Kiritimatiellae bacterium]|nr:nitroreductase family protein [Kiritimatiellia bacterium]